MSQNNALSIKQARKILGSEANELTDEQVEKLVDDLHDLAVLILDIYQEKKISTENIQYNKNGKK